MPLKIEAKGNYIICEPRKADSDKPFVVEDSQKQPDNLIVLAVGEEVTSCKPGDKILPYGREFQAFTFDGQQYIVLENHQVIGVL